MKGGRAATAGRLVRRGLVAFSGPAGEASLCHGTGVLADRLLGRVAIQIKADRMDEDPAAIGGAQLPRAQHSAGVGMAPVQSGSNLDFPPWSGGVRSERHAAVRMVIRSMLARASAGVR